MTQSLTPTADSPLVSYSLPPSYLSGLCEKVSTSLITAQYKTITQRDELLPFLQTFRDLYIETCGAEEINLPTSNGTIINGLHFPGTQKKGLIYLHGNGYFYETAADKPLRWREGLKITVDEVDQYPHLVVCNPGRTGKSEGNVHPATVARDLLAQFEYLVTEHGIDPSDIAIAGYSMGGYLASFGAALIQQQFPDANINYLSERSFYSIYSRIDTSDQPIIVSQLVGSAMAASIYLTNWAQDPIAAMESLKGRVCIIYHSLDGVIPYIDSTHSGLLAKERVRTYCCLALKEDDMSQEPSSQAHNRALTEEENVKIVVELKKMLRIPLTEEEELLTLEIL